MPTLVLDPPPAAIEELLAQRARFELDRHDEVWDGVLHMIPPPSYEHERLLTKLVRLLGPVADAAGLELVGGVGVGGSKDDYRVPDLSLHRPAAAQPQWNPTAALAIEIVSPGDKSWDKLPFYATHNVDELLIIDPAKRTVGWFALEQGEYRPTERSRLVEFGPAELAERIDWR
ncbi:MAG: Uma2 family endonuclease [Solirubrobacteraceae bacterium]